MRDIPPGTRIKDYTIEAPIGQGRYSTVYRASKDDTDVKYAIKVVSKREAGLPAYKGTRKEAILLQNLEHPHLIHVYDYEEEYGVLYVMMELLEGGDLFDKITELKVYNEAFASVLTRNLINVLHYLHSNSVCHRDIKPENLMLRHRRKDHATLNCLDCDVVLVDFGTATKFYGFEEGCAASMMDFMGTPEYMAPEVIQTEIKQRLGYNEKCDIWSTGVVVYILLCGWPPFFAETQQLLFDRILRGQVSYPPNTVWDRISSEAKDFVSQCLRVNPEERPSAGDLLNHAWLSEFAGMNGVETHKEEEIRMSFSFDNIDLKSAVRNLRHNIDSMKMASKPVVDGQPLEAIPTSNYQYSQEWEFNKHHRKTGHPLHYNGSNLLFTFTDEASEPSSPYEHISNGYRRNSSPM